MIAIGVKVRICVSCRVIGPSIDGAGQSKESCKYGKLMIVQKQCKEV